MIAFLLPDLGEGLKEAEIREWHVAEGDVVQAGQPLVSVETAKAVVEVPSPRSGKVLRLHGKPGDMVPVGQPLASFEGEEAPAAPAVEKIRDSGVVVGRTRQSDAVVADSAVSGASGIKAAPAVRALAHRLGVDLTIVTPSGPDGLITNADVQRVAKILTEVGPLEKLRGPRRAMAQTMAQARDEVMLATVVDDAVLHAWTREQDISLRLIRALVAGVRAEPSLNAWYDAHEIGRRVLEKIHLGVAVDTPDGLFVPVLQDVAGRTPESLRRGLEHMKEDARRRTIPPEELRGYTITLSNVGRFGGRYATPVIVPPTVAIVAAGRLRDEVRAVAGQARVAPVLPLSLSFDHRCVTGGEAARFLAAMIADLERAD
ncbi:MAG TPA: dihydrolipoamide acetyltransferase family protein [Ramlibacter sp.]|nr:dihydrolipoamide acetyltransferase family protein [Ramlibacter sp.]